MLMLSMPCIYLFSFEHAQWFLLLFFVVVFLQDEEGRKEWLYEAYARKDK